MSFVAAAVGIGTAAVGAYSSNKASKAQTNAANTAADAQAEASRYATDAQTEMADKSLALQKGIYDQTTGYFDPYRKAGAGALSTYTNALGTAYDKNPGYDFRMQGGVDALTAAGAVAGGVDSGATKQRLTQFGQDYATGEYNNWLNRVGGLMSNGQNAAGNLASSGQNYATGASNIYGNLGGNIAQGAYNTGNALAQGAYDTGNAQSAGYIGTGNAIMGGVQNGLSLYQYMNQTK